MFDRVARQDGDVQNAERLWVTIVGVLGLVSFVAGSIAARPPAVDQPIEQARTELVRRRAWVLGGSVGALTGAGMLLWPLGVVASSSGTGAWNSLALFSMAIWVFGFGFLAFGSMGLVAVVWRTSGGPGDEASRVLLDLSHLAVWSISAPIAAMAVAATTVLGVQADLFGHLVVLAAVVKLITVAIEVAGVGRQTGWNAGGWAGGSSGYASVAWFGLVLAALA